jgi:UDPglucose 6-dehydrogenase
MNTKKNKNILCIGAGYVGGPTMAVIASKKPDYTVTVVDVDSKKIAAWNSDNLPIYEPGLLEIVKKTRGKNLFFSTDVAEEINKNGIIFVSVFTPTKTFGEGAGKAADLQFWEKTARMIIEHSNSDKIVVEKSTLPVKTAEAMHRILQSNSKGLHFEVISNPEFMAEGTAVQDIEKPDRVLIGAMNSKTGNAAAAEITAIYSSWVEHDKILLTNVWSSELSKLVANAMLAQRISSVNSISALCEKTDADVDEVAGAVGMDSRIGQKFLKAGIGFGGSCFKKDLLNLVYLCEFYGLHEVAKYWNGVLEVNEFQQRRFVVNMIREMFNTIAGKRIAIFGFAFKSDTGDTRESPAINVTKRLLDENAEIAIYDPKAMENAKLELKNHQGKIDFSNDWLECARNAHAIAVLTDWKEFREYDYKKIFSVMKQPAFIFDGRNILDRDKLFKIGFNVFSIGKPPLSHL